MTLQLLVIIGLSTFGLTYLLVFTDGPKDIIKNFRRFTGIHYYELPTGEEVYDPPTKFFGKLLVCHWCTGTWTAVILSVLFVLLYGIEMKSLLFLIPGALGISGFLCEEITK